jgi:hypothetical protein
MKGLRVAALVAFVRSAWAQAGTCPGTFTSISAADFVSRVHPGWNLGNTLDAVPNEGSWNNAPVQASTFDTVKSAGFKSVRLPGEFDSVTTANLLLTTFSYMGTPLHWRVAGLDCGSSVAAESLRRSGYDYIPRPVRNRERSPR